MTNTFHDERDREGGREGGEGFVHGKEATT